MKNLKTKKGITLIALVITIIVLLILAGVTLSAIVGENGIINKVKNAKEETSIGEDKEKIGLAIAEYELKVLEDNTLSVEDFLKSKEWCSKVKQNESSGVITVIMKNGREYEINSNGEIGERAAILSYEETEKDENGLLKANATYTSGEYIAVVPKGFKIVEGLNGSTSIVDGLVIQDAKENEFVWIPVTYTATGELDENGLDTGFLDVFKRTTLENTNYSEPYESGYSDGNGTEEAEDYYEMMLSVQENNGFYIGRFEAGTLEPRGEYELNGDTYIYGTNEVVIKRDSYPYTMVGWGAESSDWENDVIYNYKNMEYYNYGKGAVYLSKNLLNGQDTGVESCLCYGVQWDAMLNFISTEKDVISSESWGNCGDSLWTITRTTAKYLDGTWTAIPESGKTREWEYEYDLDGSANQFLDCYELTTGASDDFAAKNIFDVSGNMAEWTMESSSTNEKVIRGRFLFF